MGTDIKFLSNLSRHEKAVNIVRFAKKSLILASGGDGKFQFCCLKMQNDDYSKFLHNYYILFIQSDFYKKQNDLITNLII